MNFAKCRLVQSLVHEYVEAADACENELVSARKKITSQTKIIARLEANIARLEEEQRVTSVENKYESERNLERKGDEIADLRRDLACTTLRLHEMKVKYEASSEAAAKHLGERQTRESDRLEELLSSSRRHASDPSTLCMLNSYADRLQVLDHEYALAEEKIEALTAELEAGAVASKKAREALESAHTLCSQLKQRIEFLLDERRRLADSCAEACERAHRCELARAVADEEIQRLRFEIDELVGENLSLRDRLDETAKLALDRFAEAEPRESRPETSAVESK